MQAQGPAAAFYARAQKLAGTYRERNVMRIVALLEEAVAYEHPDALFDLGTWYHYGIGVAHDDRKAAQFWERAAAADHLEACFSLAIACERGIGLVRDAARAFELYERCAAAGSVNAIYETGRCKFYGIGTACAPDAAHADFARACAFGHPEALCDAAEGDGPRRMPRPNAAGPFHATRGGGAGR
jgi:TPR repeat protein